MPFHVRYVLRRDFPRKLTYRGAVVVLEIVQEGPRHDNRWQLQAKKLVRPEACFDNGVALWPLQLRDHAVQ